MDVPTSGTYLLDNEDLGGAKEKRLSSIRGKKISFVFQNFALIGDYTVLENVEAVSYTHLFLFGHPLNTPVIVLL